MKSLIERNPKEQAAAEFIRKLAISVLHCLG